MSSEVYFFFTIARYRRNVHYKSSAAELHNGRVAVDTGLRDKCRYSPLFNRRYLKGIPPPLLDGRHRKNIITVIRLCTVHSSKIPNSPRGRRLMMCHKSTASAA